MLTLKRSRLRSSNNCMKTKDKQKILEKHKMDLKLQGTAMLTRSLTGWQFCCIRRPIDVHIGQVWLDLSVDVTLCSEHSCPILSI